MAGEFDFALRPDFNNTLEAAIAQELWRWQSSVESDRAVICGSQSDLLLDLECYLDCAFRFQNSAPSQDWWCDGIIGLSIQQLDGTAFRMMGGAYWAEVGRMPSPFFLAPFEIEMCFPNPNVLIPLRSIVRFGAMDQLGVIRKTPCDESSVAVIERRPQRNRDWAFAVEFTEIQLPQSSAEPDSL